jgi:hypothetical protein
MFVEDVVNCTTECEMLAETPYQTFKGARVSSSPNSATLRRHSCMIDHTMPVTRTRGKKGIAANENLGKARVYARTARHVQRN